jgi:hypothetical protein
MGEVAKHPTCFVAVEGVIRLELVAKDPLTRHDVGVSSRRHEIPSIVFEKSAVLQVHGIELVGIIESSTSRGKNR